MKAIIHDAETVPQTLGYRLINKLCSLDDYDEVVASENGLYAYLFALRMRNLGLLDCIDIFLLQNIIIKELIFCKKSHTLIALMDFMRDIPGANKEKIKMILIGDYYGTN